MTAKESPPPKAAGVSDEPMDYAAFVLYYAENSRPACALREKLLPFNEVILQDVADVPPAQRPVWLTGVPTVVELPAYKIHTGTAAMRFVEFWVASQVSPQVNATASATTRVQAAPIEAFDAAPLAADDRYRDSKAPPERTLEEVMRSRQQQQKRTQQQAASPPTEEG